MSESSIKNVTPSPATRIRTTDTLDNEFRYYTELVKEYILSLTRQRDRKIIQVWVKKLSSSGYNTELQEKRNRYMLILCITLLVGSLEGPFVEFPPFDDLPDFSAIEHPERLQFDWEKDDTWEQEIAAAKELHSNNPEIENSIFEKKCLFHQSRECPTELLNRKSLGDTLDQKFRFLLHLASPHISNLVVPSDRTKAAKWILFLCNVDKDSCLLAKGIRNDYMMALAGYLSNHILIGPFKDHPTENLPSLNEMAKWYSTNNPITNPTHPRTVEFFKEVPKPKEGAFALIALTGDLYQPKYQHKKK